MGGIGWYGGRWQGFSARGCVSPLHAAVRDSWIAPPDECKYDTADLMSSLSYGMKFPYNTAAPLSFHQRENYSGSEKETSQKDFTNGR